LTNCQNEEHTDNENDEGVDSEKILCLYRYKGLKAKGKRFFTNSKFISHCFVYSLINIQVFYDLSNSVFYK